MMRSLSHLLGKLGEKNKDVDEHTDPAYTLPIIYVCVSPCFTHLAQFIFYDMPRWTWWKTKEQTNERMNGRTNERTNKQTNKQINKQTNKQTKEESNKDSFVCLYVHSLVHLFVCPLLTIIKGVHMNKVPLKMLCSQFFN